MDKSTNEIDKLIPLLKSLSPETEELLRLKLNDRHWRKREKEFLKNDDLAGRGIETQLELLCNDFKRNYSLVEKAIEQASATEHRFEQRLTQECAVETRELLAQKLDNQNAEKARLQSHLVELETTLERVTSKKNVLIARKKAAKALEKAKQILGGNVVGRVAKSLDDKSETCFEDMIDQSDCVVVEAIPIVARSYELIERITTTMECIERVIERYETAARCEEI